MNSTAGWQLALEEHWPLSAIAKLATPPIFPISQGDLLHCLCGLVQPTSLAASDIALHGRNRPRAAEVNVRGFPAHVIREALLVAFFRQRLNFDVATIGCQAPNDPVLRKMQMRIADANRVFDELPAENGGALQLLAPDPG